MTSGNHQHWNSTSENGKLIRHVTITRVSRDHYYYCECDIPGRFELVDDANISDKIISTWRLKEDMEK